MFRDGGRGKGERVCFTRDVTTPRRHFFINFLVNESFFLEVSNTHIIFYCLKNEAVSKKHLTRNFDVDRFCRQNCFLNIKCISYELAMGIFLCKLCLK